MITGREVRVPIGDGTSTEDGMEHVALRAKDALRIAARLESYGWDRLAGVLRDYSHNVAPGSWVALWLSVDEAAAVRSGGRIVRAA